MFSRRSKMIRLAAVSLVVGGAAMVNSSTHASAALAGACNPDEFCTSVAEAIPDGAGEELISFYCNATVVPPPNVVVTQTTMDCWVQNSAGVRVADCCLGGATAPDGLPVDGESPAAGPFPVGAYELCIQASWSGTVVVGVGTVSFPPGPILCSAGIV